MNMKTCIIFAAIGTFSMMAHAQTNEMTNPGTSTRDTSKETDRRNFDPGWFGLLGLVGIAGLWRKNENRDPSHAKLGSTART